MVAASGHGKGTSVIPAVWRERAGEAGAQGQYGLFETLFQNK